MSVEFEVCGWPVGIDLGRLEASADEVRRQLVEYERGERRGFDLGVELPGGFTGSVLDRIREVPFGATLSYGELADDLGTAPRAVGGACGRNPVPVVVPCHRIVGADGSLRGYAEVGGIAHKRRLLEHERAVAGAARAGRENRLTGTP